MTGKEVCSAETAVDLVDEWIEKIVPLEIL
jgi:hypothetical protein